MRVALAFGLLVTACASRAIEECTAAYERGTGEAAIDACSRALKSTGRADIAGKLAWGQLVAGRLADAQKTVQRFGTGSGALLLTRAVLDWRGGKMDGSDVLLEQAHEACRAEADSTCAARADLELAAFHYTKGEYRSALASANRAAAEPAVEREPALKARALLRLFDVLYELGDADGAARVLGAVIDLHAHDSAILPYLRIKEGNLRNLEGRGALARQAFLDAIDEAERARVPAVTWSARLNLVKLASREGRAEEAQAQLAAAEALYPKLPPRANSLLALHYHRALAHHVRGEFASGLREIDAALAGGPADDWRWELEMERALLARDGGEVETAKKACLSAIGAVERMRDELGLDELKAWLLPGRRRPFEVLFELQAEAGEELAALQTAERASARTFLDAFVEAHGPAQASPSALGVEALARAEAPRGFLPALRQSPVVAPERSTRCLAGWEIAMRCSTSSRATRCGSPTCGTVG